MATGGICAKWQEPKSDGPLSEQLKSYLRNYLTHGGKSLPDVTTKVSSVRVKTENGGVEEVVYISGESWCGSGGCMVLIVAPHEASFKLLGKITVAQLPIKLLSSMKNGRPDIGVTVQGGGVRAGYESVLSFDGESYPKNPSLPPARKAAATQGKIIISGTEGSVFLYQ